MNEPKDVGPAVTPAPDAPPAPNKGGFGAFADVYRARWAATHPNMQSRQPSPAADRSPEPPPSAVPAEPQEPDASAMKSFRPQE